MGKKKKKRIIISKAEALRRIDLMTEKAEDSIIMAIYDEAVLEAGNDLVRSMDDKALDGSISYDIIQRGLVTNLCMTLNRLFDSGSKRYHENKRDIASIILLIRLIKQKRCRDALMATARLGSLGANTELHAFQCNNAINTALSAYNDCMTSFGPKSFQRLRRYRNHELAHDQITASNGPYPRYRELFRLVDLAMRIVVPLRLAVTGENLDLETLRYAARKDASLFWKSALTKISN